ncbi:ABC transporter permease, partial [Leucobacter sp. M11]|uniref:ABC transporter permease n=1 Tax=Leucobacter sp. M11 TaxID=2993565 RepID=UPI002D802ABB
VTGLLHTKGRIDGLLAGILTMIALWSINLRIMGKSNIQLIREETLFTPLEDAGLIGTWGGVLIFFVAVMLLKVAVDWFLSTDLGYAIQATGNNGPMISALGANTDRMKILTLSLSNGFVALSGALLAQYQGFADISMGVGLILIGLASVILGQAVFGGKNLIVGTFGAIFGAVLYRLIIFWALAAGLNPNDQKLITAVLVVVALLLSHWGVFSRIPRFGGKGSPGSRRGSPILPPEPARSVPAATPRQEG